MMLAFYPLLTLVALVIAAWASPARGLRLAGALLILGWVVGQFNTLLEAVVFNVMPIGKAAAVGGGTLVMFVILVAVAVTVLWRWQGASPAPAKPNITPLSLLGVIAAYELLYFGAGTLVFPFVQHFYAGKGLPSFGLVAAVQVPRALIFAAAAWPWLRTGPRAAPLVLGLAFSLIGGIAPLFPDNPYMPADVRFAHGIETGSSNFLFGLITGWLLRPKRSE